MKFEPKTEKQIIEERLLKEGDGTFEVINAVEKTSSAGAPMWEILLKVWDASGKMGLITDYILMTETFIWKWRNFCYASNNSYVYECGECEGYELQGATGCCKIGIKIDKNGEYDPKNNIKRYVEVKNNSIKTEAKAAINSMKDDDIPF